MVKQVVVDLAESTGSAHDKAHDDDEGGLPGLRTPGAMEHFFQGWRLRPARQGEGGEQQRQ